MHPLLSGAPRVVNIGLAGFARDPPANGVRVVQVDWRPPSRHAELPSSLESRAPEIERANAEAHARIPAGERHPAPPQALAPLLPGEPPLARVGRAGALIPALDAERLVLHAGPPIAWERMCGPLRGAVCGALVYEGWAPDLAAAERLAESGGVRFAPNHHYGAVGPMTGITTRSQPLLVVENRAHGNRALCTINEGLGKVMRFGGNDAEVLARLAWLREEFAPLLDAALRASGGVALAPLIARGLAMGDEMHQRNVACTSLLVRALAPQLARAGSGAALARTLDFIAGNDQFFLNVAIAMAKSLLDPVRDLAHCTVVTAMARNGTDFGVQVSALGGSWFTAPAQLPQGLYFPGYGAADANPDMGDSAILEALGLGAFAMAAAPAVAGFVGAGGFADAVATTRAMSALTVGRNARWQIPALEFAGTPTGVDIRRVVETGGVPALNTGIAHRRAGVGQVGAGVAQAPLGCFEQALRGLADAR